MEKRWTRPVLISASAILFSIAVYCQQPAASSTSSPIAQPGLIPGTLIQVEMTSDVDVKKIRAGDIFRTRLWADARSGEKIILPQKTIIVGHVVESQPRTKANPESRLTIAIDKAVLKDGSELPLRGVVERVQLSPIAMAAAGDRNATSYKPGLNPGSTTNIAMPAQVQPGEEGKNPLPTPGPTNVRDPNIAVKADASGTQTTLTSASKDDVKLKHYATLDIRITRAAE